jgi:glycerophosphoryl diester phosphodiesterase
VLDLPGGPLVLAHSDRLEEVSHGAALGRVRDRSLAELREVAPELPTLDEALAFFAEEAPEIGLHVDLKLTTRLDELAASIEHFGLTPRTVVSAFHTGPLRAVARANPRVRIGFTYPEDRFGVSRRRHLWPVVGLGLSTMRASVPHRIQRLVRRAGATALMLQHRLVTPATVARAHAIGVPVLAWTVDERADVDRVVAAGVDGVITNDPTILVAMLST